MNCRQFEDETAPFDLIWDQLRLGTTYYQVVGLDRRTLDATAWFVLLYVPLWPVGRYRLRREGDNWNRLERRKLSWASVASMYLTAYFLVPLGLVTPMFFALTSSHQIFAASLNRSISRKPIPDPCLSEPPKRGV